VALVLTAGGTHSNRYLHGPAVDEVLADDNTQNTVWALRDQFYSVRDLIYQSGGHHNHIDYDSFGKVVNEWHPAPAWIGHAYGFQSRERDQESGQNYHRNRYLQTSIGRWTSEDPIAFEGDDVNLNRFVANQPNTQTDPDGLITRQGVQADPRTDPQRPVFFHHQWKFKLDKPAPCAIAVLQRITVQLRLGDSGRQDRINYWELIGTVPLGQTVVNGDPTDDWTYPGFAPRGRRTLTVSMEGELFAFDITKVQEQISQEVWKPNRKYFANPKKPLEHQSWTAGSFNSHDKFIKPKEGLIEQESTATVLTANWTSDAGTIAKISQRKMPKT
jgi:RHS repeat-associated protein